MRGYSVDVGIVPIAEKDKEGKVSRKQLEVDFVCNLGSSRSIFSQSPLCLMKQSALKKSDHSEG